MSIRNRLTLWYGGILLVSLLILSIVVRLEWQEHERRLRSAPRDPVSVNWEVGEVVVFYGIPTALMLLAGGWWLLRRTLAPVAALTRAAEELQESNLRQRLPTTGSGDELDRLTEVFNSMLARLDQSFAHIREFTLNASHELKTPLTVMRGQLETRLREPGLGAADRDLLADQLDEIQRLTRIVDGLGFLARADAGRVPLSREAVPLDRLVQETFLDTRILAQPLELAVELTACDAVTVNGDRHRLKQLLLNLAENAVKHNEARGHVTLALERRGDSAVLTVTNTGPGLPAELVPRVFERFFRGDATRARNTEGCGLGLSIAHWIVTAHGGTIRFESDPGRRTTVTVELPLAR